MPRKGLRKEIDQTQIIESKTRGTRSTRSSSTTTTTTTATTTRGRAAVKRRRQSSPSPSPSENETSIKRTRQSSKKTDAKAGSKTKRVIKRRVGRAKSAVEPESDDEPEEEEEEAEKPKTRSQTKIENDTNESESEAEVVVVVRKPKNKQPIKRVIKKNTKFTPVSESEQSNDEQEEDAEEKEKEEEKSKNKEKEDDYKESSNRSESEAEEEEEESEVEEEESEVEEEELSDDEEEEEKKRKASFLKKKRLGKALTTATPTKKKPVLHAGRAVKRVNQISEVVPLRRVNSITSSEEQTPYALARERLHVSAVPDSLPCREEEFVNIMGFVESAIEEGTGTCVYISGVPGTGKTATVLEVIRHLQQKAEDGTLPEFDFVEINGMKLTDPNQAYSILWDCVDQQDNKQKKRYTPSHALHLLETEYINNARDQRTTVVLMDELDLLVTKKQTVMYNFFDWPSRPLSKLIVIAVANTMDLPERLMSNKIASRMGLTRINFQPYNYSQLYQIVQSRLEGINAFGKEAVEFAARKVSAVSGDARRALDICRRAVEIVETRLASGNGNKQVTIAVVDEAIKEMFTSPAVAFVRSCSLHQKIFLVSCMQRVRSIGLAEIEFGDVAHNHVQTCKWHNIEPPNTSDLMRVCESLGQSRALVMESGSMDIHMRLSLNLVEEDILMACKADKFISMLLQKLMSIE